MKKPERSPFVEAHYWVSFVTTIVLEMVLPVFLGLKLDEYWGTGLALTIVGAVLGMVVAIFHLIRATSSTSDDS
jgi:F0F1-type ATP synthase assembly protein I